MGRGRIFIYLALILILGLVALVVVWQRLNVGDGPTTTGEVPTPPPIEKVDVVVTTQRVERGADLTEDVVQVVSIPRELLVDGMITNPNDVIGLRAKFDLDSGIPLTRNMLVETVEQLSSAGSIAALLIPSGKVAVSIPISRLSSVSYGLERGDQVNVIVTMPFVDLDADYQSILPNSTSAVLAPGPAALITTGSEEQIQANLVAGSPENPLQTLSAQTASGGEIGPQGRFELEPTLQQPFYVVPSEPQRPRLVSQTLIQGAIVLQVGTFELPGQEQITQVVAEPTPSPDEPPPDTGEQPVATTPRPPDVITLIVDPQDAVTLNYLMFNGAQLTLAMRAAEDSTVVTTEAVTLQFLLDVYNIPVPAKLPYGTQPRIFEEIVVPMLTNDIPLPTPVP